MYTYDDILVEFKLNAKNAVLTFLERLSKQCREAAVKIVVSRLQPAIREMSSLG